ncbi:hypothetical protein WR164_04720 [Philodulcilactobacillus myokoensis]|uniref:Uncharacterized protein n=1 Tax=Philodulcilactobacillus myokoensis TaxID=2929573 RepID=A0A9W6ESM4_9LACO|nr:hypothetical protein [Philodulcilactobacillus myokoensis]GLB46493.1 hypothetical protein WR164_04720 [Philodulcilactobacillus myokoensis]
MDKAEAEKLDKKFEHSQLIDEKMSDVFDWSKDDNPVRDAIWNHYMEADNHDTMKTADEVEPYLDMSDDDLKAKVTSLLKK